MSKLINMLFVGLFLVTITGCKFSDERRRDAKLETYISLYEKKYGKDEADLKRAEIELLEQCPFLQEPNPLLQSSKRSSGNLATGMMVGHAVSRACRSSCTKSHCSCH